MINNIKTKLFDTKIFIDNEYLDKYVEIIQNNLDTKCQKNKTQCHHIFPKCFCLDYPDTINLYYKDHVLAHYYICKCVLDEYMYPAYIPLRFMLSSRAQIYEIDEIVLQNLQELYEDSRITCDSRIRVYNPIENIECRIFTRDVDNYISNGYIFGSKPHTKEFRQFILDNIYLKYNSTKEYKEELQKRNSKTLNNLRKKREYTAEGLANLKKFEHDLHYKSKYVYKDDIVICVPSDKLDLIKQYLSEGYRLGNPKASGVKDKVFICKDSTEIAISKENVEKYLELGWTKSSRKPRLNMTTSVETRQKQSITAIGKNKGKIHITNGVENKFLLPEEASIYLDNGYYKGRTIVKNNK